MRFHPEGASAVRKVKGVDGDAMATPTGAGVEAVETERLGGGGVEDMREVLQNGADRGKAAANLPYVDVHFVESHLQLIDQGNIDAAVHVLHNFRRFSHSARTHFVDGGKACSVQRLCQCKRLLVVATNDFRD